MSNLIEFPKHISESQEKRELTQRYAQLLDELDTLESKLANMSSLVGGMAYDELQETASDLIIEMQLELASMRERKFFSPKKRRELLQHLREVRGVMKSGEQLWDEFEEKRNELYDLGIRLGYVEQSPNLDSPSSLRLDERTEYDEE